MCAQYFVSISGIAAALIIFIPHHVFFGAFASLYFVTVALMDNFNYILRYFLFFTQ